MDSMAQVEGPTEIASEDPSQVSELGGEENLLPPVYHFPESASSKKKLLVLDVNGILADIVSHSSKKNYIKIVGQKMDQTHCTNTGLKTLENEDKPLFLKERKEMWNAFEEYNATNTLLVDDSPYKALKNPAHTVIFPKSYNHMDVNDFSLGDNGDLRMYLKDLVNASNVQDYVRQHPFGQPTITRTDKNLNFYSHKILANSTYGQKNEKDAIGQA
ncbi:C-terminal domain small phosphatase isoform X2 [Tripterygium wilfordii]|uniref:C-terminal domain small phosphatase isoform X2 n=1 Tax=Tripterygium wilfordii TaxID=458696 RepID=A0A7J7D8V4_TRIWF|nr:C-terminal domain small phosphatase isoform X2 [Tripterygium wilfordii]